MSHPASQPHRPRLGAVCAYFAAATLFLTWPLAADPGHTVAGFPGDNLYFIWLIEWYQKAVLVTHQWPWTVPVLNYPEGYSLAYTEYTPATVMLALPVSLLFGAVSGYNLVVLLTFVLSGLGIYLFIFRLTASSRSGLIGGTVFAFCTYRMNHLGGHITLMGTQWLAFYFLSLHGVLELRGFAWCRIAVSALFLVLMSMTAPYYLYMSLVLSVAYVLGYLWLNRRTAQGATHAPEMPPSSRMTAWQPVSKFAAVCLLAAPFALLALAPYIQLRAQGGFESHSLVEAEFYSASPTDFLVPMTGHILWGRLLTRLYHGENALYLGVAALALAAVALAARNRIPKQRVSIYLFAATALCAMVFAMGVALHWLGAEFKLGIPDFFQRWWPYPETFIPLPGYLLYRFLPFYSSMRVWMRYGIFVSLFVSVLAGLGAGRLVRRVRPHWQLAGTGLLLGLALLDSYRGPIETTFVQPRAVDEWLAAQPGRGAVATFPFFEAWKPEQTFFAGVYNKPYIGGHFAAFHSPQFDRIRPVLDTFPDAPSVALLKSLGVQYVLVDSMGYADFGATRTAAESYGLRLLSAMEGSYVFELPNP